MYKLSLRPIASDEYNDAADWYGSQSISAGDNFVAEVENKLELIKKFPLRYKTIYKNYHEAILNKYPYSIVYIVLQERKEIEVIAVYHHKRNPKKKYR